jgi:UDP-2-acetamido-3-amino-2,3-dideoxy-glucuronate N-acetyltransferase
VSAFVHPTAMIEDGVVLGEGTAVWDGVHIRRDATVGRGCIIG